MAKGGNSLSNKRSRNAKPYDANNSFVKKVATRVTDLIPQRSWISKWFNSSQDNGEMLNDSVNPEDSDNDEEPIQPPVSKRPRIRMDVTHPPGTFNIQPRSRTLVNEVNPCNEQYLFHNETTDDFLEPPVAGTSGIRRLVASTPAVQPDIRNMNTQRSGAELISLTSAQNNGATNGTDDNSESSESTSGCSSLIPQINRQEAPSSLGYNRSFATRKRYMDDKLNFTNHLQSPRSLFLDSNTRDSLSSRRPSFNASVMNNSLERGSSIASPFYNGNTTFGGANTAGFQRRGRNLFNSTNELQLKIPNRTNIQVKSPNAAGTDSSGMSQTAKRILEALEQFSSPILDAKKIPINAINNSSPYGGRKRQRDESGSPMTRVGLRHLTRELNVPTVPDLLKLRRRQRLQDTTVAARKIVSARSGPPPSPQEYKLRSGGNEKSKYSGKVKAKDKTEFDKDSAIDTVNLPNIALPISTLPAFDIMLPFDTSSTSKNGAEELFKFASPIKVTDTSRNLKSINNFTFSKPINANEKVPMDESYELSKTLTVESSNSLSSFSSPASNFMWSKTSTAPKLREKSKPKDGLLDGVKVSNELKTGSVMDVLGSKPDPLMEAWKPAVGMWECSQCLIRNDKDVIQCVACKASKSVPRVDEPLKSSSTTSSAVTVSQSKPLIVDCFGSRFKMSSSQWECGTCLVVNKLTDIKCVSCTTPRSGSAKAPPSNLPSFSSLSGKSDLMEKFKPAEGSWECPGCMLRNPASIETCPCCNASKPGSMKIAPTKAPVNGGSTTTNLSPSGNKLGRKDSASKSESIISLWECVSCKVKNPSSIVTCPCLSVPKSNSLTSFGDKFKKPEGAWTCDDCMLQNKSETNECAACGAVKPGSTKVTNTPPVAASSSSLQFKIEMPENSGGFKFGIPKSQEKGDGGKPSITTSVGFTFGTHSPAPPKPGGFTFGAPQNSSGFTFGIPSENKTKPETTTADTESVAKKRSLNTKEPESTPVFSFGVPKTEAAKVTPEKQLAFGAQPAVSSTGASFSFGGLKATASSNKTNDLSTVTFGIPPSASQKLIPSASTGENLKTTSANDQANSLPSKSSADTNAEAKPILTSAFGTTSTAATIGGPSTTTISTSVSTPGLFTFGNATLPSQPDASSAPTFVQNPPMSLTSAPTPATVADPSPASASSMFSLFGANKSATTTAPTEKSSNVPFGTASTPAFNSENSAPLFDDNKNQSVPAFGMANTKTPSLFGGPSAPAFGGKGVKLNPFESTKKTSTTSFVSVTPVFDVSSSTTGFGSTTPAFGTVSTPAFGSNPTSTLFAASKVPENPLPPAPGIFTFGGSAAQSAPQPVATGFNFSGTNPAAPTPTQPSVQKSLFTFGNSSNTTQPGTGFGTGTFNPASAAEATPPSFTFNAPKPDAPAFGQSAPNATSMFGIPQNTPSFGQGQPTPAFGSTAPAPSAGFNFAAASSGFNFSGSLPAAPPAGGFTFDAPSSNPSLTFDPNTRPAFDFTGGTPLPAFNAPPQLAPVQPQRKFKKAVRRAQPR